jgi:hypothetical protein
MIGSSRWIKDREPSNYYEVAGRKKCSGSLRHQAVVSQHCLITHTEFAFWHITPSIYSVANEPTFRMSISLPSSWSKKDHGPFLHEISLHNLLKVLVHNCKQSWIIIFNLNPGQPRTLLKLELVGILTINFVLIQYITSKKIKFYIYYG